MSKLFSNPFVLALITAIATSVLGYLINQLPEIPNKGQNTAWIIGAVVVITLLVWVVAVLQNQQPASGNQTIVRGNVLRGKRNMLRVSQQNADVSRNTIAGEEQEISVDHDSNSSGSSSGGTL